MTYNYYPGCCIERDAVAWQPSIMAATAKLGIDLAELEEWNCCGATEYFPLDELTAHALVGRNLALAASRPEKGNQLVTPCSACYVNLATTDRDMSASPRLDAAVNTALDAGGLRYDPGSVRVRHLLDVIAGDVGFDAVARQVTRPLSGLRVAAYYGCLIGDPGDGEGEDSGAGTALEELVRSLGAEAVGFPLARDCCGGHMDQVGQDTGLELVRRLLRAAVDSGADAIVTACPMCRQNLETYQDNVNQRFGTDYGIPVLYFTQLMCQAFDCPAGSLASNLPSAP